MQLINSTRMVAGYTLAVEPDGRELLVSVVKGTFRIPVDGGTVRLADEQEPLVMADTFTGEPGLSAPLFEVDFAPRKRRCDVLLIGSAYAPEGRPAARVQVGLRVGGLTKTFRVVGNRRWRSGLSGVSATDAEPFTVMPISYDRAFGGVDYRHHDPMKHAAFRPNPAGRGFHAHLRPEWVNDSPLPNTEELDRPVDQPNSDKYVPMAFGAIGRAWEPRYRYAGTYDAAWMEKQFPFLPTDFDDRYYQAAPVDQQVPHPQGNEEIRLVNLMPTGTVSFTIPVFDAPIHYFLKGGGREDGRLVLDTIVLEPDESRFMLTWRATRPLRRNIFEVSQVLVGKKSNAWWSDRGKVRFPLTLIPVAAGAPASSPASPAGEAR